MSDEEFLYKNMLLLEELHKSCQLADIGIIASVLNETRYFARNITFFQYYRSIGDVGNSDKHLAFAKNALLIAVNDTVDSLVTHIKLFLNNLKKSHPEYDIAFGAYRQQYATMIGVMHHVSQKIVDSRGDPVKRVAIYSNFAFGEDKEYLKQLANFALLFPTVELDAIGVKQGKTGLAYYQDLIEHALVGSNPDCVLQMWIQSKVQYDQNGLLQKNGGEALIRLLHCNNLIPTNSVIEAAEAGRQIIRLDFWILERALAYLANHQEMKCLSVNLTPVDLSLPDYSDQVKSLIEKYKVNPQRLELEITERSAVKDTLAIFHIQVLSEYGVRFAIDDFGTGETKFDYIAELPVTTLKIDMSIIRKYAIDSLRYGKLIAAIASIGHVCGLNVIAEGVDSELIVDSLRKLNVKDFQGYYFSKPMHELDFVA